MKNPRAFEAGDGPAIRTARLCADPPRRNHPWPFALAALLAGLMACTGSPAAEGAAPVEKEAAPPHAKVLDLDPRAVATLAGGCFWCMEKPFEVLPGVAAVISGYSGGPEENPAYKDVARGKTGHTEAVQVHYDPDHVSYADLLQVYWRQIDPTDARGQFVDRGAQYRPEIFVHDAEQRAVAEASKAELAASGRFDEPIAVAITDFDAFWPAEEYHQDFYRKDPSHYQRYRSGSGRDRFIDRWWGAEKDYEVPARAPSGDAAGAGGWSRPDDATIRSMLTEEQFRVTQRDGTEAPFRNAYWNNEQAGIYVDVVSGEPLFSSTDKFKSGTGWPSFTRPLVDDHIVEKKDSSHFMIRTEVRSKNGDSHLGHLFDDGPRPTGMRYCINSAALRFVPVEKLEAEGYGDFVALFRED